MAFEPQPIAWWHGFRGSGDLRRNVAKLIKEIPEEVIDATKDELETVKKEMQRIVPYRSGDLHDSHEVLEPELRRSIIYAAIQAGVLNGDILEYAIPVHEDLEAVHAPPRVAKWFEITWNAASKDLLRLIVNRLDLRKIVT